MHMEQNNELKVLSMRLANLEAFVLVILERRKKVIKCFAFNTLIFHITSASERERDERERERG